ncbi:hypothetical protein CARUB_v10022197mg [Capsella rubella]|uniref:MADS-box domain-containing protein n=1 Tax=Capsella rubella TaxID=81985 RepID=R0HXS3_9BRAS|nr:hypothetical protein CARUB_v10022197mg [Capsella rubella]
MGGLKRKIDIKKIGKKDPRAVTFSKRRKGLYSKASDLCLLSDAQMAILATPVSSNSHASFYSFGHSSVDSVVEAFLTDQTPPRNDDGDDEKLGFWWEDESLIDSEDPEELGEMIDSMKKMLHDLKELENKGRDQQTLNHQPCSSSQCIDQVDVTVNHVEGFHNNTEEQTLPVSDYINNNNGLLGSYDRCDQEFLDQIVSEFLKNTEVPLMHLRAIDDLGY